MPSARSSYDRAERGSAFSRCGGADAHSCCRASKGVSCYYLVPMAMCEAAEAAQVAELRQLMSQLARSGEPDAKAVAHACLRSLPGAAPPPAAAPAASSSWFW